MTDFPPLGFGDRFLRGARACLRCPSGRLWFKKPQWDRSLHWVKLIVQTDASCQSSDTRNTIDNQNAGITLILINNIIVLQLTTSSLPSALQS